MVRPEGWEEIDGARFRVLEVEGSRIERLEVELLPRPQDGAPVAPSEVEEQAS